MPAKVVRIRGTGCNFDDGHNQWRNHGHADRRSAAGRICTVTHGQRLLDARVIIEKLRDGADPTQAEMNWFANGLATGGVTDAQAGAFAMAALLKGMSEEGRVALTLAMRDSGDVLQWSLDKPAIDKHLSLIHI